MSWDPAETESAVRRTGFGAIAAPGMLPALLSLRRVRGDVGVRTPLSTVEKLIVPSSGALLLGSNPGPVLGLAAGTMAGLGHSSGIAIQGVGGGLVPSLTRRTRGVEFGSCSWMSPGESRAHGCSLAPRSPPFWSSF